MYLSVAMACIVNTEQCFDAIQLVTIGGRMSNVGIVSDAWKDEGYCLTCLVLYLNRSLADYYAE